jgi:CheY-like chemotaxis protein
MTLKPQLSESGDTSLIPQSQGEVKPVASVKRVLVVDDETHIANTLAALLRDRGYDAAVAYDAVSGLAQCETSPPDLIISDVVMPRMNGVELAMVAKQLYPACKVLLACELATSADFLKEAGKNGYDFEMVAKPVQLSDLLSRIAALT